MIHLALGLFLAVGVPQLKPLTLKIHFDTEAISLPRVKRLGKKVAKTINRKANVPIIFKGVTRFHEGYSGQNRYNRELNLRKQLGGGVNEIHMAVVTRRYPNDWGVSLVCGQKKVPLVAVAKDTPWARLKFIAVHEVGHALGAEHRQPLFPELPGGAKATIMYPYYLDFFYLRTIGEAVWRFSPKNILRMIDCRVLDSKLVSDSQIMIEDFYE